MYGKVKGNFKQVLYNLGVFKYSNEDSSSPSSYEFDKHSRSVYLLKSFFYGLLVFYTLFVFTNKVSANESLSSSYDDGSLNEPSYTIESSDSTEPTEPTESTDSTEPTNSNEPVVVDISGDLVLTNNLLYYIAFMTTLGVFYNMIRNTFKRGLN